MSIHDKLKKNSHFWLSCARHFKVKNVFNEGLSAIIRILLPSVNENLLCTTQTLDKPIIFITFNNYSNTSRG